MFFICAMTRCHLGVVEDRRLAEGQRLDVEPRQGLDLDGVGEALGEGLAERDLAVLAEQAGGAAFERLERGVR